MEQGEKPKGETGELASKAEDARGGDSTSGGVPAATPAAAQGPPLSVCRLDELPDVLTPAEVASLLRVGKSIVYAWAKSGQLPSIPLSRDSRRRQCVRFAKAAIEGLIRGERLDPDPTRDRDSTRSQRGIVR